MTAPRDEQRAPVDVAEGRALLTKATRAPWEQRPDTYAGSVWITRTQARGNRMIEFATRVWGQVLRVHSDDEHPFRPGPDYPQHENDAAAICWLRNNAEALLAELAELRALKGDPRAD